MGKTRGGVGGVCTLYLVRNVADLIDNARVRGE